MALKRIQGLMRAEAVTVAAFNKVNAVFGGKLKISSPDGAWRSPAQQNRLHALFLQGRGPTAVKSPFSNHEKGMALDIWNWAQFPTLQAVMKAHGFTRDAKEQWHYNFTGVPAAKPVARPVLKRGSKSAAVGVLQTALGIHADKSFGQLTETAVIAFQRAHGLHPDGIVGNATWAKLVALKKI